jgi:hypothetical protein
LRDKDQLQDLVLDAVLAEIDMLADPSLDGAARLQPSPAGSEHCWNTTPSLRPYSRAAT